MDLPRLTLYSLPGCHLCEQMLAGVEELRAEFGFAVTEVDIDSNPVLQQRYGEHIPVLVAEETELCRHFLDAAAVRAHCAKFR